MKNTLLFCSMAMAFSQGAWAYANPDASGTVHFASTSALMATRPAGITSAAGFGAVAPHPAKAVKLTVMPAELALARGNVGGIAYGDELSAGANNASMIVLPADLAVARGKVGGVN